MASYLNKLSNNKLHSYTVLYFYYSKYVYRIYKMRQILDCLVFGFPIQRTENMDKFKVFLEKNNFFWKTNVSSIYEKYSESVHTWLSPKMDSNFTYIISV